MSELTSSHTKLSIQDYLEGELHSLVRHEYIAGNVYSMAGGTRRHNQIALNIGSDLERGLEGVACTTYMNDVKVHIHTLGDDLFYYPDVMVGCDPTDDHELYLERPSAIIEVLSQSTERTDRQEKFHAYRSLPSLKEYVLVSQDRMDVTLARADSDWVPEILSGADSALVLPSLGQSIPLSRIYRNVDFSDTP